MDLQPRGDFRRCKSGTYALVRVLDLDAGALEEFEQWPRTQLLLGESDRDALWNMCSQIRKWNAVDQTHAYRTLQKLVWPNAERLCDCSFRPHVIEGQKLDCRAATHIGKIGQDPGNVGTNRPRRRPINDVGSRTGTPVDQSFAC